MKKICFQISLIMVSVFLTNVAFAKQTVMLTCHYKSIKPALKLVTSVKGDQQKYFITIGNKTINFPKRGIDLFLGVPVVVQCLSDDPPSFIFNMTPGSPYFRGAVVRIDPKTYVTQFYHFAEKGSPFAVFYNDQKLIIIMNDDDISPTAKYVQYEYDLNDRHNMPKPVNYSYVNKLPDIKGLRKMSINPINEELFPDFIF